MYWPYFYPKAIARAVTSAALANPVNVPELPSIVAPEAIVNVEPDNTVKVFAVILKSSAPEILKSI